MVKTLGVDRGRLEGREDGEEGAWPWVNNPSLLLVWELVLFTGDAFLCIFTMSLIFPVPQCLHLKRGVLEPGFLLRECSFYPLQEFLLLYSFIPMSQPYVSILPATESSPPFLGNLPRDRESWPTLCGVPGGEGGGPEEAVFFPFSDGGQAIEEESGTQRTV